MSVGNRDDQKYEDLPLSTLFKSSYWGSGELGRRSPFPCGEGTVEFLKAKYRKTHSPGEGPTKSSLPAAAA